MTREDEERGAELKRKHTEMIVRERNARAWKEGIESDDRYGEDGKLVRPRRQRQVAQQPAPWWYRFRIG